MLWVDAAINRIKKSTNKLEITSLGRKVSYFLSLFFFSFFFFEEVRPGKLIASLDQKIEMTERKKMERETKFPCIWCHGRRRNFKRGFRINGQSVLQVFLCFSNFSLGNRNK